MCRIFPIHDTSKRQSTLAEVFVGDPSEVGVGTGSNAVAGPVVGRHAGAHELTRRFDICKASADRSPRADTLAATDRRVCANQSPASGLIWAESPASPRQVERTCAACRSGCGHRAWLPGVRLSRSAIGTGYGRQHDRICDRCDLADERMSAKGQTVGSVRLGAATGPVSMKTINSWPSVVGRDPMLRKNDGGLLCFRSAVAISLSFSRLSKRLHRRPLYLRGKV